MSSMQHLAASKHDSAVNIICYM